MQLWFAHGSDVPIREQLVTQVILGILSDDLAPGQRLPSTRELARRFHVHPNTISAGYHQLERERLQRNHHAQRRSAPDRTHRRGCRDIDTYKVTSESMQGARNSRHVTGITDRGPMACEDVAPEVT